MYILMADDDKDDFIILQEAAERAKGDFELAYAPNWLDLSRMLYKQVPDVIFLDLNMPVKDGFECLELIREDRKYKNIPVIIYSTSINKADIDKSYELDANYFVVKPNTIEAITKILKRIAAMGQDNLSKKPPREEFIIL